ncbi:MAG TPA: hypothetical protein VE398_18235 [Acidobacteriota bacterium]|nr:hypothetical protein [Acidobacteriota bacterium]
MHSFHLWVFAGIVGSDDERHLSFIAQAQRHNRQHGSLPVGIGPTPQLRLKPAKLKTIFCG